MKPIHLWRDVVPPPTMTIFLDAPAEILIACKGEGTVEYFDKQRASWLAVGEKIENFCVIDVTIPVDTVYENVMKAINTVISQQEK